MRVFLDANILFSAAKSAGAIRELLALLKRGGGDLWADAYVVEEARRNLAAKAPDCLQDLNNLLKDISFAPMFPMQDGHPLAKLPDKDLPVLDAAVRSRCDFLLTGDRTHFGALYGTRIRGVEIIAPAALAMRLPR